LRWLFNGDRIETLEDDLGAEFDYAACRDAEIGNDVVGLPREKDEKPVLPHRHSARRRNLECPPADEK
jgi:hypothetical protein